MLSSNNINSKSVSADNVFDNMAASEVVEPKAAAAVFKGLQVSG
jgi:hypothetical protein